MRVPVEGDGLLGDHGHPLRAVLPGRVVEHRHGHRRPVLLMGTDVFRRQRRSEKSGEVKGCDGARVLSDVATSLGGRGFKSYNINLFFHQIIFPCFLGSIHGIQSMSCTLYSIHGTQTMSCTLYSIHGTQSMSWTLYGIHGTQSMSCTLYRKHGTQSMSCSFAARVNLGPFESIVWFYSGIWSSHYLPSIFWIDGSFLFLVAFFLHPYLALTLVCR